MRDIDDCGYDDDDDDNHNDDDDANQYFLNENGNFKVTFLCSYMIICNTFYQYKIRSTIKTMFQLTSKFDNIILDKCK